LAVKRKEPMLALRVLYLAVVQNSKKWNVDRAPIKKGTRQRGDDVRSKIKMMATTDSASVMPRQKDRMAMPSRDFGCPEK
jgi:hypothetical protein